MGYFLTHPVDSYPYWPPLFIQRPYTIVGIQIRNKLQDLAVNQRPTYNVNQIPIAGIPRPATFSAMAANPEQPRNHEYRGTFGPTLYDYFWKTVGYTPDPTQPPGTSTR